MNKLINVIAIAATLVTASSLQASNQAVNLEEIANLPATYDPTPGLEIQTFGQYSTQNDFKDFGVGISLEAQIISTTAYVQLYGVTTEDDAKSLGVNLLQYAGEKLSNEGPICYLVGGTNYNFEFKEWNLNVGGGVSWPISNHFNIFADASYAFSVSDSDKDGGAVTRIGISYKF